MDVLDISRVFCPTTKQYTFFSVAHETFYKIGHILRCKASLNKFNKIEKTPVSYQITMEKTRPQQQKKLQKIFKHMETEQHNAK
jgi:hypothetical protein